MSHDSLRFGARLLASLALRRALSRFGILRGIGRDRPVLDAS